MRKMLHAVCKPISCAWLILLLLTVSCTGSISTLAAEKTQTLPDKEPIPSRSVIPPSVTPKKEIISTGPTITPLASVTAVSTQTPLAAIEQLEESIPLCINGDNPLQMGELGKIDGAIFFSSGKSELFTLSGIPPLIQPVSNAIQTLDDFIFSPNAEWLVGFSSQPDYLPSSKSYAFYRISKSGHVETVLLNTEDIDQIVHDQFQAPTYYLNYWSFEWINDGLLKVTLGYGENRPQLYTFRYVDIVKKTWLDQSFRLPEQDHPFDWSQLSPDETRVVYLNNKDELVLFDLVNQKELWKVFADRYISVYPTAQWSRDSQRIAFITKHGGRDIQVLSADGLFYGHVKRISFSSSQEFIPGLAHYTWSPNNRHLAISGMRNDQQANAQQPFLYLYDVLGEQYEFRCPMGSATLDRNPQIPLFSSDGSYLTTRLLPNTLSVFWLYDLNAKTVYQIQEGDFGAFGWVEDFSSIWK